jgi:hypothetical protein
MSNRLNYWCDFPAPPPQESSELPTAFLRVYNLQIPLPGRSQMNRDCKDGLRLRLHFEHTLKEWGWFDAYERALELMPVGLSQVHEFRLETQQAHSELSKARHAYVDHMSTCLVCSRRLITSDAVVTIREKLNRSGIQ